MARNFSRSSNGTDTSRASSSTRALNSIQLNSRFNNGTAGLATGHHLVGRHRVAQGEFRAEDLLEQVGFFFERQLLQGEIGDAVDRDREHALFAREAHVADLL